MNPPARQTDEKHIHDVEWPGFSAAATRQDTPVQEPDNKMKRLKPGVNVILCEHVSA